MPMVREQPKTDRGRDVPSVRQVSVFTENRVGALSALLSTFDSSKVRILALAVIQGFDCAIVRFVFNDTDAAAKALAESNYRFTICDLVAVEMPAASVSRWNGSIGSMTVRSVKRGVFLRTRP